MVTNIITDDLQNLILAALACIRKEIGSLTHVKKIAYSPKGQLLTVWTFVDNTNPDNLRSIYKKEQKIMDSFPDLRFDFTVIFDSDKEPPHNFVIDFCS